MCKITILSKVTYYLTFWFDFLLLIILCLIKSYLTALRAFTFNQEYEYDMFHLGTQFLSLGDFKTFNLLLHSLNAFFSSAPFSQTQHLERQGLNEAIVFV